VEVERVDMPGGLEEAEEGGQNTLVIPNRYQLKLIQ
jgi:hypothetical protein